MTVLTVVFCVLFTSCRHTVPAIRVEARTLDAYTGNRQAYLFTYDKTAKSFFIRRKDWKQTKEKVMTTEVGVMRWNSKCFTFSDGWMKHSLWNGKRKKNMEWMMIPPLTLYPVLDTVILGGCFLGDFVMYPFRWLEENKKNEPVVLSAPKFSADRVVLAEIKFDKELSYQDVANNRKTRDMSDHSILIIDRGRERYCRTDKAGRIPLASLIAYPLPIRGVNIFLDSAATRATGSRVYFSTENVLTAEEKRLYYKLEDVDTPTAEKKEILKKLKSLYIPEQYARMEKLLNF